MTNYVVLPYGQVGGSGSLRSVAGSFSGYYLFNGDTISVLPDAYVIETTDSFTSFAIDLNGTSHLINSGTLETAFGHGVRTKPDTISGPYAPTIINTATGVISGGFAGVLVTNGIGSTTSITNSGQITGSTNLAHGIQINNGGAIVSNTGTISGGNAGYSVVSVATNGLSITNSGTLVGSISALSTSGLTLDNTGGLIQGNISSSASADTVDNNGGTITGVVNLGAGNDTFTGSEAVDKVIGGNGADTIDLNGGNDIYYARNSSATAGASDGNDEVDGGTGIDTYVANATGASGVTIDLLHGIATGTEFGTDQILNFENATGTANADSLLGNAGRNVFNGNAGSDSINGLGGNDRLVGGAGADTITGSTGQDVMTGGAGPTTGDGFRDTFVFSALSDSGSAGTPRDWITDFTQGAAATADRINLVGIDANTALVGNQAFIWQAVAGAAFTGVKGQLHYAITNGNTYISGDVNGDKVADFSIGLSGSHALAAVDFIL